MNDSSFFSEDEWRVQAVFQYSPSTDKLLQKIEVIEEHIVRLDSWIHQRVTGSLHQIRTDKI